MSSHNDALGHHGTTEWATGTQHRSDQFSQPQIQADWLNYACKTTENSLIEKCNPQKFISNNAWWVFLGLDRRFLHFCLHVLFVWSYCRAREN